MQDDRCGAPLQDAGQRVALHERRPDISGKRRERAVFALGRLGARQLVDIREGADPLANAASSMKRFNVSRASSINSSFFRCSAATSTPEARRFSRMHSMCAAVAMTSAGCPMAMPSPMKPETIRHKDVSSS
jgi:hypothetical protein